MAVPAVILLAAAQAPAFATPSAAHPARTSPSVAIHCDDLHSFLCADVYDPTIASGGAYYVGHDEPATLFYSNKPGAGNNDFYVLRLPKEPPVQPNQSGKGGTDNFQLHPAFWFGMAMCDTQSYPEHTQACTARSDSNIFNSPDPASPKYIGNHTGTAFMEMQFYPPGWVSQFTGTSCAATQWCGALNIDSLSTTPGGVNNNAACLNAVGVEPVNFAYITKNGVSQGPANPVDATLASVTPDPAKALFMNSGDVLGVSLHDTNAGFQVNIIDFTRHTSGSMTASVANGFGQVNYQPNATTCTATPYAFHPMYSTSSPATRVPWAAHSYNIAFSDEIGHFEFCNAVDANGACTTPGAQDTSLDADDFGCLPASASLLVQVTGCLASETDFDGSSYQKVWPGSGSPQHDAQFAAQPVEFTSPVFNGFQRYSQAAFEADLPRIEAADFGGVCNRTTGAGCTNPPPGAQFYPIYTTAGHGPFCHWQLGGANIPGTTNTYGGSSATEYGSLLSLPYASVTNGQNSVTFRFNNFQRVLPSNPC
jgi:hypothetical protein